MWYATLKHYPEVNKELLKGIIPGPNRIQFELKKKNHCGCMVKHVLEVEGQHGCVWGDQLQGYCVCLSEKEMFSEWVLLQFTFRGQSHWAG